MTENTAVQMVTVDFEPIGKRVEVQSGTDLLSAAQQAGVGLISLCGGIGACDSCRVRMVEGKLTPPTPSEREVYSEAELSAGLRLACQARALTDVKVDLPPDSLSTAQRLQIEGIELDFDLNPAVKVTEVRVPSPDLDDLRSDASRLEDSLHAQGLEDMAFELATLTQVSDTLRSSEWLVRVAHQDKRVLAVLPPRTPVLGLAVDIGTTKLAAYLVDLEGGATLHKLGAMNPQVSYGEDVISRIAYVNQHSDGRALLQSMLVDAVNALAEEACTAVGVHPREIVDAVVVGNTAMHHLFLGLPVRQLGLSPYVPAVSGALTVPARELGLAFAPGATIYLPPVIAGYVGADHTAMLIATGMHSKATTCLAYDIGTNTEITLAAGDTLLSCSCASGPAFEGAHIHDGMRAAPGAIERIQIVAGELRTYTIESKPPVGICGSGILDAVASLLAVGVLDEKGRMMPDQPLGRKEDPGAFVLVSAGETGHGREIVVTRSDVNEIQLAKGAIRAGAEVLLSEAGRSHTDLDQVIVAGAFGTYLDVRSALRVGMFPPVPVNTFHQVGNAAGIGAIQLLLSVELREAAVELAKRLEYVELTTSEDFTDRFLAALLF